MNLHTSAQQQIDDATVQRYFEGAGGGSAATVSMMSHEHNLPASAARYRLRKEIATIGDWLDAVGDSGHVLDVGCGAGAWVEIFAKGCKSVTGIERSPLMVEAARERVAQLRNAEILLGDGRRDLPEGPFDLIFLGGLCMYLEDTDVVALLQSLKGRFRKGGSILLRESTVRQGRAFAQGDYQAVYRSVSLYHQLFEDAGTFGVEVRRNYGYNSMVTGEELVDLRRKWLPFLPKNSPTLGSLTWWALRATTAISLWALPRMLSQLNTSWPKLQNHFFKLRLVD